jgi:predicted DsbA family dithiol-disulfide isomerase
VKVEVFSGYPPCPECAKAVKFLNKIVKEYKGKVELIESIGPNPALEKYKIDLVPAIVVDETIKIIGIVPSSRTLRTAIEESLRYLE